MNIYTDFLSREEIEFITQCKQKKSNQKTTQHYGHSI
ncbi:hypothetical protein EFIBHEMM_01753 [Mannheimia haemolytica]